MTFSPTIVHGGGEAVNVIPSHASVDIDCRILPGHRPDDVRREVDAALAGIDGWEFAWTDLTSGNESPPTALSEAVERVMDGARPGLRIDAAAPVRLHRFALVPRSLSGYRRLRLLPVRGRGLGDHGRPRARPRRTRRRRRPALPGALLRAPGRRAARLKSRRRPRYADDPRPTTPHDPPACAPRPVPRRPARPRGRRRPRRSRRVPHPAAGPRSLGRARRDGRRRRHNVRPGEATKKQILIMPQIS